MSTLIDSAKRAYSDGRHIIVEMESGLEVKFPVAENPRLAIGTLNQLNHIELTPFGMHWPDLDEDLSFRGILQGRYGQTQKKERCMKPYRNRSGESGVLAYEYGPDWIRLRFAGGQEYKYTASSVGPENLETMKHLADVGDGLATFINTHPEVKNGYV